MVFPKLRQRNALQNSLTIVYFSGTFVLSLASSSSSHFLETVAMMEPETLQHICECHTSIFERLQTFVDVTGPRMIAHLDAVYDLISNLQDRVAKQQLDMANLQRAHETAVKAMAAEHAQLVKELEIGHAADWMNIQPGCRRREEFTDSVDDEA